MDNFLGLLKVRVIKGTHLAIRDLRSSDPYVVVKLGNQKVKTRVIKRSLNPVWDDELTLYIPKHNMSLKLQVLDKDTFSRDDSMGDADIDLQHLSIAVRMQHVLNSIPTDTKLCKIAASEDNCLAKDSCIQYVNGAMVQDVCLRLQNVESGELELQLKWIDLTN